MTVARIELSKHKDEAFVPHGAEPLPNDVVAFNHISRISKFLSFGFVSVLTGACLPYASMMLASETPSGETLGAARLMCAFSIIALLASIARHLSPFITSGITVYREDSHDRCLPLIAMVAMIAVLDAATFGAATAAAIRPLSSIALVRGSESTHPGGELLLSVLLDDPNTDPSCLYRWCLSQIIKSTRSTDLKLSLTQWAVP